MKTRKPTSGRRPQGGKPTANSGRYKASGGATRSGPGRNTKTTAGRRGTRGEDVTAAEARKAGYRKKPRTPATTGKPQRGPRRDDRRDAKDPRDTKPSRPAVLTETMRIAKAMARSGLCSRREAERWIEDGRVSLNGDVLETPAKDVGPGDKVLIDGHPLPAAEPSQIWRYHKPKGLLTTHRNDHKLTADGTLAPDDRQTVFENLPPDLGRVISVGRLDYNTEGLLLLTNDGALARYLELPTTGWLRRYRVRVNGLVTQERLNTLSDGVTIDGVRYGAISATLDSAQGANSWLTVAVREGKNREVRKIMEHLGLAVNRLIRVSFGPFQLLDLKPGQVEPVKRSALREQLSRQVVEELGLMLDDEEEDATSADNKARPPRRVVKNKTPPRKDDGKKSSTKKVPAGAAAGRGKPKPRAGGKPKPRGRPSSTRRGGRA